METNNNLYIPVNIKTHFEFFDGFGVAELIPTALAALLSGALAFAIHAATGGAFLPALLVMTTLAGSVMLLAKGEGNQSALDQIRYVVRFAGDQQAYRYRYTDEWGGED